MSVMVTTHLLTRADLDALPDDGLRHELIDGHFVMTPAPGSNHQTISMRLATLLDQAVLGTALQVLPAPFDVVLGPHVVEPDLLMAREVDVTPDDLPVPPLLVIEILSPSTAYLDRGRKRDIYAEAGIPHYWIVDPNVPAITVYELIDGTYAETAHASGDQTLTVEQPVTLRLNPAKLLRRSGPGD